jgi:hypothetical protein
MDLGSPRKRAGRLASGALSFIVINDARVDWQR